MNTKGPSVMLTTTEIRALSDYAYLLDPHQRIYVWRERNGDYSFGNATLTKAFAAKASDPLIAAEEPFKLSA